MTEISRFKYAGSTPGADTNVYPIFDTTVAFTGKLFFAGAGIKRFVMDLEHSHEVELNWYRSSDRGVNWIQLGTETMAAPAASETNIRDFLVEGYDDWKLEVVNGGSAQTSWDVQIWGTNERGVAD